MMNNHKDIIQQFKDLKVLVVGDAILDAYLHGTSSRICREAPVPLVEAQTELTGCGGAANTAINVSALGAQTTFLTVLGNDDTGKRIEQLLRESHVDTSNIFFTSLRKSISKRRVVVSGNIVLRIDEGSTDAIPVSLQKRILKQLRSLIPRVDALLLSDYGLGLMTNHMIEELAEILRLQPVALFVDSRDASRFKQLSPYAVKPNWEETLSLLNLDPKSVTDRIAELQKQRENLLTITGAKYVVATVDTEGALILSKDEEPYRITTVPQESKNTIGAGDTFISALTLASAAGAPIQTAADIASAAAAIVLQKDGTVRCTNLQLSARFNREPKLISSTEELQLIAHDLHDRNKKIVFTNGCFDLIHKGHVDLLKKAKEAGDTLIVGINTDESARKVKGPERPVNSLEDRISVLAALESIDYIVPFDDTTPVDIIRIVRPRVFVKGSNYTVESIPEAALLKELSCEVKIISRDPNISTSNIINKIHEMI